MNNNYNQLNKFYKRETLTPRILLIVNLYNYSVTRPLPPLEDKKVEKVNSSDAMEIADDKDTQVEVPIEQVSTPKQ